jgi:hypothetical protein
LNTAWIAEQHIRVKEMPVNESLAIEKTALTPLPLLHMKQQESQNRKETIFQQFSLTVINTQFRLDGLIIQLPSKGALSK